MYFAMDHCNVDSLIASLLTRMQESAPGAYWLASLDAAFDHGRRPLAWTWTPPRLSLYESNRRLVPLNALAPQLITLNTSDTTMLKAQLHRVLFHCSARPMLSFLNCSGSAEAMRQHWQGCVEVVTEDNAEPYVLRFADTRVLPAVATMPDQTLWRKLTHFVGQWLLIDRAGQLQSLNIPAEPTSAQPTSTAHLIDGRPLQITTSDLGHLLRVGLPDNIIDAMADHLPDLLPERGQASFYETVCGACRFAEQHDVQAFPDVLALAVAAHATQGRLLADDRLPALVARRAWHAGQLGNALAELLPKDGA